MARKTKLTKEVTKILVSAIEMNMNNILACKYAGISESSFYGWLSRGKQEKEGVYVEFLESIKRAEGKSALRNLAIIQKAASEGSWHAAAWLMERKHKYTLKQDPLVEIQIDNSELNTHELLEEIQKTNIQINELLKQPVIDMDE